MHVTNISLRLVKTTCLPETSEFNNSKHVDLRVRMQGIDILNDESIIHLAQKTYFQRFSKLQNKPPRQTVGPKSYDSKDMSRDSQVSLNSKKELQIKNLKMSSG